MVMISIPILTAKKSLEGEGGVSQRTEYYTTAKVHVSLTNSRHEITAGEAETY
jgi:hypothetical protein